MSIKIEPFIGKKYIARDGEVWTFVGLSERKGFSFVLRDELREEYHFRDDGGLLKDGTQCGHDLIAEWTEPDAPPAEQPETLRDRFAMAALTGILADSGFDGVSFAKAAEFSYAIADAMMEARKK